MATQSPIRADDWILEGYPAQDGRLVRTPLHTLPFRIGRAPEAELSLRQPEVSSIHAEIIGTAQGLLLRDLGSRNGTFLNHSRVQGEALLKDGDVLHVATAEFRLVQRPELGLLEPTITRTHAVEDLPRRFFPNPKAFQELLSGERFNLHYQPIVSLDSGRQIAAWEALGRPAMSGLPDNPTELFRMAEDLDAAPALSRAMRTAAVRQARGLPGERIVLFVNTHPSEMNDPLLLPSLAEARRIAPDVQLVLEIHEGAVTALGRMREIAADLASLDVQLAYDDFGSGQARLLELVEAPPAFLKFDRSMIAGLPSASFGRRQLVQALVAMVRGFRITTLAEGVETEEEASICAELGFELGQGWVFGKPAAARS